MSQDTPRSPENEEEGIDFESVLDLINTAHRAESAAAELRSAHEGLYAQYQALCDRAAQTGDPSDQRDADRVGFQAAQLEAAADKAEQEAEQARAEAEAAIAELEGVEDPGDEGDERAPALGDRPSRERNRAQGSEEEFEKTSEETEASKESSKETSEETSEEEDEEDEGGGAGSGRGGRARDFARNVRKDGMKGAAAGAAAGAGAAAAKKLANLHPAGRVANQLLKAHNKRKQKSQGKSPEKKKTSPLIKVGVAIVAVLLLLPMIFSGSDFNEKYALEDEQRRSGAVGVPDEYLKMFQSTALDYDVPWTVLAGLAKVQTDHGARSPYDQSNYGQIVNRAPDRKSLDQSGNVPGIMPNSAQGSASARQIIDFMSQYKGTPYVWGGQEPGGFDCSGLMLYSFSHFGIQIPRTAREQQKALQPLDRSQIQPGDLIFWGTPAYHVGLYVGDNQVLHAPQSGDVVKVSNFWSENEMTFGRILDHNAQGLPAEKPSALGEGTYAAGPLQVDESVPYIEPAIKDPAEREKYTDVPVAAEPVKVEAAAAAESDPVVIGPGVYAMPSGDDEEVDFGAGNGLDDSPGEEEEESTPDDEIEFVDDKDGCLVRFHVEGNESVYPCTVPAIGKMEENAKGIFLILPSATGVDDINPQNVRESTQFIARELKRAREALEKERGVNAGRLNFEEADEFWATAVRMLPIADPNGVVPKCGLPSAEGGENPAVADSIRSIWQCELGMATTYHTVKGGTVQDNGTITFEEYEKGAAVDVLLQEALAVSWAWSQWGGKECNGDAEQAGIFPLTAAQAEAHGVTDRCDVEGNIRAAAKTFLEGEKVPVAARSNAGGAWLPMNGGWGAFRSVLGDAADQANFAKNGPYKPSVISAACTTQIRTWATTVVVRSDSPFKTTPGVDFGLPDAALRAKLEKDLAIGDPALNPICADVDEYTMLRTKADVASGQLTNFEEGGHQQHEDEADGEIVAESDHAADSVREGIIRNFHTYISTEAAMASPGSAIFGSDSLVERLSANGLRVSYTPPNRPLFTQSAGIDGELVVGYAIYYGGIMPNDPRAGTLPSGTSTNQGTVLNIVLDRQDQNTYSLHPKPPPDGADVKFFSNCGSPSNSSEWARVDVVEKFERMCQDAVTAGIQPAVVDGTRTYAEQAALLELYGPARAAQPGRGTHERGSAVDMGNAGGTDAIGWAHQIVGCFSRETNAYNPYASPINNRVYATALEQGAEDVKDLAGGTQKLCSDDTLAIKRIQTYGLLFPICGPPDEMYKAPGIRCDKTTYWPSGQLREDWHFEPGVPIVVSTGSISSMSVANCGNVTVDVNNPQTMAVATYTIFRCAAKSAGLDDLPATTRSNGSGPAFRNLSEQIAAEAVVVGYCESGYAKNNVLGDNPWGYGGVFQFGDAETAKFIPGGNKFDPVNNIIGASKYFLAGRNDTRWGGWGPWAVVNTDYGGPNTGVKIPVLPRFPSSRAGYEGQFHPGPLPNWAVNPAAEPPNGSCSVAFKGGRWV